jgi:RNA polymerase sigma-54 factor
MLSPTDIEKQVGSLIIGNLNKDGYLQCRSKSLALQSGVSIEDGGRSLETMQSFDPVGVCARDLRECLLLQAHNLGLENSLVTDIISGHLNHLENKNYKAICRALKVKIKDVIAAVNVIKALEPKPGRQFSEEEPHYIIPDIYVYKSEGEFCDRSQRRRHAQAAGQSFLQTGHH